MPSNTLDGHSTLTLELLLVCLFILSFAVLQARTLVSFQHSVSSTIAQITERTIANDSLCRLFAVLGTASNLSLGCAATDGQGEVDGAVRTNIAGR